MADFIKSDLDFILAQIRIAEGHSAFLLSNPNATDNQIRLLLMDLMDGIDHPGDVGTGGSPITSFGLRTVDGSFNNLIQNRDHWGQSDQAFEHLLPPEFRTIGGADYGSPRGPASMVTDATPRVISNLIVDMTSNNPAATAAYESALERGADASRELISGSEAGGDAVYLYTIPNIAPDEGLSAPFNSWMTLFGQFFDHGLDLVAKGGGNVFVPLQPDDPLYVEGSPTNFMIMSRAASAEPVNNTTPFVDQNQTYASNASHQVFLREYVLVNGRPVATGELIQGENGGMATWADVKAQALSVLGISLSDYDALRVPQLLVDPYGNFIPSASGFPQLVLTGGGVKVGNIGTPVNTTGTAGTQHAFLLDIAHAAAPVSSTGTLLPPGSYDAVLLGKHFIAGDGRANENIALTAVHHVFHSEHNRLVQQTKDIVIASLTDGEGTPAEDLAFLNEWLRVDVASLPTTPAQINALQWDGERLFQAARFGNEMQYQHLVFEDFARKIQPMIDIFVAPNGYDVTVNPGIFAEFAHTVYRFGHSMLTETIDRFDAAFNIIGEGYDTTATAEQIGLVEAFLNPIEFDNDGAVDADVAAGAIIRGMTRQVGNEIDEFVTDALRSNLLGLPLDLATINIARGRDTGIPTLNDARKGFFNMTGDSQLRPYESWFDFALSLKNQASIVNFIAAYGTHSTILNAVGIEAKRDAAMLIVFGGDGAPLDAEDFLHSEGAWANTGNNSNTGLDDVDFWIGGLAEKIMPFGGMLGSTFAFVFETQLENLQNGDRFYYLARTAGMNFLSELENNSFTTMIVNNTDARHLPIDVFSTPAYILEVQQNQQYTGLGADGRADPTQSGLIPLVDRNPGAGTSDPTGGLTHRYLKYNGGDHVVLGGTEGNDRLIGSIGDDTFWGDGGNDTIEGGTGNDNIDGGAGDDIITDSGGDDVIKGGAGNDVIHAGNGIDLIIGGHGRDFIITGQDVGEVFAGNGDDFIYGQITNDAMHGNEGNDWIERGTQDGAMGDNANPFGADDITGHDVFLGSGSFDEYVGEGGDDIMVGSAGPNRNEGMSGFDWVTYFSLLTQLGQANGIYADLELPAFDEDPNIPIPETAIDRYENVEGLSGGSGNDTLIGSEVTAADIPTEGARGSLLRGQNIDLIAGLRSLLQNANVNVLTAAGDFDGGNIILGGRGNDEIEGRAGDDVIHGDRWLEVYVQVYAINAQGNQIGNPLTVLNQTKFYSIEPLIPLMVTGQVKPHQLRIQREIVAADPDDVGTSLDTAVYLGLMADYTITSIGSGAWRVTDNVGEEGSDTVYGIEQLRFSDAVRVLSNGAAVGSPDILEATPTNGVVTPTQGQQLTASAILGPTGNINDPDGIAANPNITYQWQQLIGPNWTNIGGATLVNFTPTAAEAGRQLRVVVTFTDGLGNRESRASPATDIVGNLFQGNAQANTFVGNDGANLMNGLGGADTLSGGLGNDTVNGNDGADVLAGNGGDDVLTGAAGADTMLGGDGNDSLVGGAGVDSLDGGAGDDTMVGGAGNDIYVVDSALDVVTEAGGGGTDTVRTTLNSYTAPANVEHVVFIGTGNFDGVGNGLANALTGGAGDDTLNGAGGADTLNGGEGADSLLGGAGVDSLVGGGGNDSLNGQAGADIMVGGAGDDFFFVDVGGDQTIEDPGGGIDTIVSSVAETLNNAQNANIENLILIGTNNSNATGNVLNNEFTGNAGNNTFTIGQGGNDVIKFAGGAFGNDTVAGFDANPAGGQDLIDLRGLGITAGTFAGGVTITDGGNFTVVSISDGTGALGTLRLNGVNGDGDNIITIDDFIL